MRSLDSSRRETGIQSCRPFGECTSPKHGGGDNGRTRLTLTLLNSGGIAILVRLISSNGNAVLGGWPSETGRGTRFATAEGLGSTWPNTAESRSIGGVPQLPHSSETWRKRQMSYSARETGLLGLSYTTIKPSVVMYGGFASGCKYFFVRR